VTIDEDGICNYCSSLQESKENQNPVKDSLSSFIDMYEDRKHQAIMAYSGGKDSTYILKLLKEKYNARVLAVTFDNGFISERSIRNIKTVTNYLGFDSLIVSYPAPKLVEAFKYAVKNRIFPIHSIERASSICNMCITFIKNILYYEAIIREIPIVCFGWTPGQVRTARPLIKLLPQMILKSAENIRKAVVEGLGNEYGKYFLDVRFLSKNADKVPYLYYPFVENEYNEGQILLDIKEAGWCPPRLTDGNSSNCLLNSYANMVHMDAYGFHPYAFEISNMIRSGLMTREEGLKKIEKAKNNRAYNKIRKIFDNKAGEKILQNRQDTCIGR
jgi:hypothetical protein